MAEQVCPECGAPMPSDSESNGDTPCAACLMKLGMRSWQEAGKPTREVDPTLGYEPPKNEPSLEDLADHFPNLQITRLIGRGGMGSVYEAKQKSLDRTVALKLIRSDATQDPSFAERFVREARALAQLSHPNIVTVHDFGQADDFYYFVMEYVNGTNLRHLIVDGKLPPDAALQIVPRVCDALQYAHDHGIVHRDIKPENILIDKSGNVKIADFGLAKLVKKDHSNPTLTKTHQVMGTMHYMAPEQLEKPMTVDHRADIYSLGVVIYEMLTGELPLGRFAPPSQKVQVDVRLDEIVLHSLEKEPSLRYQKISQIKTDMESVSSVAPNTSRDAQTLPPGSIPRKAANQQADFHTSEAPSEMRSPIVRAELVSPPGGIPANRPNASSQPAKSPLHPPPKPSATADPAEPLPSFFGVAVDLRTYASLLYLLLSFPLGIIYFVVMITGLSLGFGLLIVWVGLFVLVGTVILVRGSVDLERRLANSLLGANFRDNPYRPIPQGLGDRLTTLFTDSTTYTGFLFLLLKFPLGIVTFCLMVTVLSLPLSCMAQLAVWNQPWAEFSIFGWEPNTFWESSAISVIGFFLLFVALWCTNALAWCHRMLAQAMLTRL